MVLIMVYSVLVETHSSIGQLHNRQETSQEREPEVEDIGDE
jgi:hypothetical protein